ncbi:MAG: hypothetical protein M3Z02_12215 [Actinomycetota bacterium]|nr:hypothetical protein [Actinomycetota bacterium]
MGRPRSGWDCPPPRRRWRARMLFRRRAGRRYPTGRRWHRTTVLRWPLRTLLWLCVAASCWLLAGPMLAAVGLFAMETVVLLATLRRLPPPGRRGGGRRPPDAGVREPRRPHPTSGLGAMALPLPGDPRVS